MSMTPFPTHSAHACLLPFSIHFLYRDRSDNTPLHLAAKGGHAEIASLLVKADAPLEAKETYNDVSA